MSHDTYPLASRVTRSSLVPAVMIGVVAGLLLPTGCRSSRDNQIDLLERELRAQEDYIYELEDYVMEYSQKLRQARRIHPRTVVTRQEKVPDLATDEPERRTNTNRATESPERDSLPIPKTDRESLEDQPLEVPEELIEPDTDPEFTPEDLEAPDLDLEIGEPVSQLRISPAANQDELSRQPAAPERDHFIPDPVTFGNLGNESGRPDEVADGLESPDAVGLVAGAEQISNEEPVGRNVREAEHIVITKLFRSYATDDLPASFLTVVEARDTKDEPADFDGAVSLMVMTGDPEDPQKLKRWDFTAEETASAWQSSHLGDGLHLELPLDDERLPAETIELWVRLITNDGRKLLAELPFEVAQLAAIDDSAQPAQAVKKLQLVADETRDPSAKNPLRSGSIPKKASGDEPVALAAATDAGQADRPVWRAASQPVTGSAPGTQARSNEGRWTSRNSERAAGSATPAARDRSSVSSKSSAADAWKSSRR